MPTYSVLDSAFFNQLLYLTTRPLSPTSPRRRILLLTSIIWPPSLKSFPEVRKLHCVIFIPLVNCYSPSPPLWIFPLSSSTPFLSLQSCRCSFILFLGCRCSTLYILFSVPDLIIAFTSDSAMVLINLSHHQDHYYLLLLLLLLLLLTINIVTNFL